MKKLFIALCFMASFKAKSQTVDTTVTHITACRVVPFAVSFTDTTFATHLGVRLLTDNLKDYALTYCEFFHLDTTINTTTVTDTLGHDSVITSYSVKPISHGYKHVVIKGEDYANWDNSNLGLFRIIADKLKIIFQ